MSLAPPVCILTLRGIPPCPFALLPVHDVHGCPHHHHHQQDMQQASQQDLQQQRQQQQPSPALPPQQQDGGAATSMGVLAGTATATSSRQLRLLPALPNASDDDVQQLLGQFGNDMRMLHAGDTDSQSGGGSSTLVTLATSEQAAVVSCMRSAAPLLAAAASSCQCLLHAHTLHCHVVCAGDGGIAGAAAALRRCAVVFEDPGGAAAGCRSC